MREFVVSMASRPVMQPVGRTSKAPNGMTAASMSH